MHSDLPQLYMILPVLMWQGHAVNMFTGRRQHFRQLNPFVWWWISPLGLSPFMPITTLNLHFLCYCTMIHSVINLVTIPCSKWTFGTAVLQLLNHYALSPRKQNGHWGDISRNSWGWVPDIFYTIRYKPDTRGYFLQTLHHLRPSIKRHLIVSVWQYSA